VTLRALAPAGLLLVVACRRVDAAPSLDAGAAEPKVTVQIKGVPHLRQKPDFCGEACLAMALRKLGQPVDQEDVFDRAGVDPKLGRGAYTAELNHAANAFGFRTGQVWFQVEAAAADRQLAVLFNGLHEDLLRNVPSIVCMHFDEKPNTTEHFRLVLGYDASRDEVIYHEPAEAEGAYLRMSRQRFLRLWPLHNSSTTWSVIRIALDPGRLNPFSPAAGARPADLAQHVMKLRSQLPRGFAVGLVRPFFVIAEAETALPQHLQLVGWTVSALQREYFSAELSEIVDVWLFKNSQTYARHVRQRFGQAPTTPYGFYSPEKHALYMNIGTGGGTLVHELVHPFLRGAFPKCPAWFSEGLASLYERSTEKNGHIWGLPNWRLESLRRAIEERRLPSFAQMTSDSDQRFYDSLTGYAQARFLCLYLQDRGLLRRFYFEFLANHPSDPTGYNTLMRLLGSPDSTKFQQAWERWAMNIDPKTANPDGG
jgi:hypothetical protein